MIPCNSPFAWPLMDQRLRQLPPAHSFVAASLQYNIKAALRRVQSGVAASATRQGIGLESRVHFHSYADARRKRAALVMC